MKSKTFYPGLRNSSFAALIFPTNKKTLPLYYNKTLVNITPHRWPLRPKNSLKLNSMAQSQNLYISAAKPKQ